MIHAAFGKPKIVQGHCSFHPAAEVTDDGAKAIPETSEMTSKICQPSTLMVHEPHNVSLLGEGHHAVTRGPSKAGQELAVGLIATCTPLKIKCYLPDLLFMHAKYYVLHHFQDQVLPRLKNPKRQTHHVMIANIVIFIYGKTAYARR